MFKNKKIYLIILVFILFFGIVNNSFATDTAYPDISFTYNDVTYVVSNPAKFSNDFAKKYCIFLSSDGSMSFAYSVDDNATFIGYKDVNNLDKVETGGKFYFGNIVNNEWVYSGYVPTGGFYESKGILVYSNQDVIHDKEGNVFFQVAPPILARVVEQVEMKVTMREIIQILPLIIVVVVSLVGLRKALQMLLRLLRRCLIT